MFLLDLRYIKAIQTDFCDVSLEHIYPVPGKAVFEGFCCTEILSFIDIRTGKVASTRSGGMASSSPFLNKNLFRLTLSFV